MPVCDTERPERLHRVALLSLEQQREKAVPGLPPTHLTVPAHAPRAGYRQVLLPESLQPFPVHPMLKFIEDLFDIVLSIIKVLDRNGDL